MRRGMTLLELLVALTLGAILVLLSYQVFRAALDGRVRVGEKAAEIGALRRAYEVVSRDFHSAVIPPDGSDWPFGLFTQAGPGIRTFRLASTVGEPLLAGRPATETVLLEYAVAEDPRTGRPALWRFETPYPPDSSGAEEDPARRAQVLLPGVTGVTYLFYREEDGTWVDAEAWDSLLLPNAVRMDLALENPGSEEFRLESWIFALPAAPGTSQGSGGVFIYSFGTLGTP